MKRLIKRLLAFSAQAADHGIPAGATGATLDVGLTNGKGMGVFIYRAGAGHGPLDLKNVKLRWLHGADGVADPAKAELKVFASEMVYVPRGAFKIGSGGTETGSFTDGSWTDGATIPLLVDADWSGPVAEGTDARRIGKAPGRLWGTSEEGMADIANAEYTLASEGKADERIAENYSTTIGNANYDFTRPDFYGGAARGGVSAVPEDWPEAKYSAGAGRTSGKDDGLGSGLRGGFFGDMPFGLRLSDRGHATYRPRAGAFSVRARQDQNGFRGVRTAPLGDAAVGPAPITLYPRFAPEK